MGLFGKKKIPDGIRVMFYGGDLTEFSSNFPCQILLMDDVLRITKVNPYVEVKLNVNRISSIEIFSELEYMSKYKGTSKETTKEKGIHKEYYVIKYVDKMGKNKHLDFWGTAAETLKIMKIKEKLAKDRVPQTYEI